MPEGRAGQGPAAWLLAPMGAWSEAGGARVVSVGVSGGQGLCSCPCCAAEPAAATASPPMTRNKAQALPWRLPLPLLCFWFCGAGRGTGWACVPRLVPCRGLGGSGRSGVWAAYGLQTKVFFILFLLDAWGLAGAHGQNPEAGAQAQAGQWLVSLGLPGVPGWIFFLGTGGPLSRAGSADVQATELRCRRDVEARLPVEGSGCQPRPQRQRAAGGAWRPVSICV